MKQSQPRTKGKTQVKEMDSRSFFSKSKEKSKNEKEEESITSIYSLVD